MAGPLDVLQVIGYPLTGIASAAIGFLGARGQRRVGEKQTSIQQESAEAAATSAAALQLQAVLAAAAMWQRRVEQLEQQAQTSATTVADLTTTVGELRQQLADQKAGHDAILATKGQEIAALQAKVAELERAAIAKTTTTITSTTTTEPVPAPVPESPPQAA